MTRIGTPAPGIVPTSLTQGSPTAALLAQLPSTLSDVASGALLTGIVLDRAANGMTMLQTANGLLGLKTTVPLPLGSTVTLQIQTAGAQLQAIVLSITPLGQGATLAPAQSAPPPLASIPTPNAAASSPAAAPPPSTIVATVIGPSGGPVRAGITTQPQTAPAATPQTTASNGPASPPPQGSVTIATTQNAPPPATPNASPPPNAANAPPPQAAPATAPQTTTQQAAAAPQQTAIPAATQAYQRQLNAVPALPLAPPVAPPPQSAAPVPTNAAPPALLAQDAATAKPQMPDIAPTPLPTGTQVQVRLLPSPQGGQPVVLPQLVDQNAEATAALVRQAATNAAHPNAVIMATVVARTPAGQVILDSAVGRLLALLPRDGETTAPGAKLLLELITGEKPALSPRPATTGAGLAALARNWSTLKDVMRQVQDAPAQQDAAQALDRAVPKPGPKLAQQMLSYLESAQTGVKTWLGDTVAKALNTATGHRLLDQLDRDMREMHNARHGAEGDWRMTLIPLLDGQELRQIRFFERRRKQEQARRKKEEPGRFVVECEHSEHGALQLDGLVHEKRLDVIVRSHEPLPAEMEHDILVIFGETCTGLDLTGQLFFQAVAAFPVNPLDEIAKEPVRVSV